MKPARTKPTYAHPVTFAALAVGISLGFASADAFAQTGKSKPRAPSANAAASSGAADDAKLKKGIALFQAHDNKRALAELERLHATTKKPRALYWIGRVHEASNQPAHALNAFKRYEREGGSLPTATQRELTERIQTLSMQVAAVTVTAPEGSSVSLDDAVVGTAPLAEPIFVDPGAHKIAASGAESKTIDLTADSRVTVELSPTAPAPAAPAVAATPEPAPASAPVATAPTELPAAAPSTTSEGPSTTALTVGGLALASVFAAGSVYFSMKTADSTREIGEKRGAGASRAEIDDIETRTRIQAGVAVGLGVGAAAAVVATIVVYQVGSSKSARVVTTGNGVSLIGKF